MITEIALSSCENSRIAIFSNRNLSDFECALDVVIPTEGLSVLQVFLDLLEDNVGRFGLRSGPSKCQMLLQNWIHSKLSSVPTGKELSEVD